MEKNAKGSILKIAVVGSESTGKSTLAEALANYFSTVFVPEYAREYISNLNRKYKLDDIELIAKRQLESEKKIAAKANKILICDTTLLVTKIWSQHAFEKCPNWILENYKPNNYALHLLTDIDFEWQPDPQREHPHLRNFFFDWYKNELIESKANFIVVSGNEEQRLNIAINAIQQITK